MTRRDVSTPLLEQMAPYGGSMAAVDLTREGDVFVLRLVDDDNRFRADSVEEWSAALDQVEGSEGPAALVTTGTGKFYSNGLDLDRLIAEGTMDTVIPQVLRLFARMVRLPVFSVAAVNGHAFAAGGMMALAHDARVMRADRGYWCLPEVDMGVWLAPGMSALVRAKLPAATAHEAIVTGRRYGGLEAAEAGIVHEARPDDEVLPRAIELAAAQAGKSRDAVRALKEGMYPDLLATLDRADLR
jgi:enoyl-CoA hydratase/carnithine racemase